MAKPAPNTDAPLLEMSGVSVPSRDNPEVAVLENVNWTLRAGEYWLIGGLQSSGKTEFLSLTAGLMRPLSGSFRLFGTDMPVMGDEFLAERLRIGLVFDGGQLFHNLTIEENIALPLRYHRELDQGDLAQTVQNILELTGLLPYANRLPGNLGRGWQTRAGLARALVLQPEVLLLDNPAGGLDFRQVQWWMDTLDQLSAGRGFFNGRPTTLVVATEDLRPWRQHAAHFAVLQNRKFNVLGHHPQLGSLTDPLVKELLAESLGPK
jgi:ABC-type transporter Mla maintaining outer membrane lipid asymmetry ATPase subunit MlaF